MSISINSILFIIFSTILIISGLLAIVARKMVYTLLFSMLVFSMVGCLFVLLGANYNAVVQLLVYIVTIPVLIATSIMFLKDNQTQKQIINNKHIIFSILGILILIFILGIFFKFNTDIFTNINPCILKNNTYSELISISQNILGNYKVLLFEFSLGIFITVIGFLYYEK